MAVNVDLHCDQFLIEVEQYLRPYMLRYFLVVVQLITESRKY